MRPLSLTAVSAVFLFFAASPVFPQGRARPVSQSRGGGIWTDVIEQDISSRLSATSPGAVRHRDIVPRKYRTLKLNKAALKNLLASAATEKSGPIDLNGLEFEIPHPKGGLQRFLIQESPIMEPKLAARYPELKTYVGRSLDYPGATLRMDVTPRGFHAIVLSAEGQIYIDPYSRETDTDYISYFKQDFSAADKPFSCTVENFFGEVAPAAPLAVTRSNGDTLRIYRLALACTGEYAAAVCSPNAPTVDATLAAMITTVNRCSAIYERELAIRFVLVDNTDKLIYLNGSTDPYTNNNGSAMLGQNQTNIDNVIGSANYDFGHVLSTGGGGIAALDVVCASGMKARGVTGSANPVGDPYDVDYVAHEIGHQFGANHPFDGTSGSCSGNGNSATAYEPGSGSTIMAYAGICAGQDLAPHSDDYFHTISYDEIMNFVSGTTCAQQSATGNTPPTVSAAAAFNIPARTPFALTASAIDTNGDTLSYCWEELDHGPFQDPTVDPRDNGSSPLFRSFPPTTNPTRIFPSLTYILNNQNLPPALVNGFATGEYLPTTSRTMSFRVTVRDNHPGGGGVAYSSTTVTSVSSAGPFVVTSPNTSITLTGGSRQIVTWHVAGTDIAPISCANVKISLSTDGGNTFPIVLANSVPNNGFTIVVIPNTANVATTQGRIKVEAVGNIFFDISDANLTITSTNSAPVLNISGGITVVRGKLTPTVATVGSASDAEGNPVTVAVSDLPFGAHVTPATSNGMISLSATVDCSLVTTLSVRTYPITLTVTDSNGSTSSGKVDLNVSPNPSPTLGAYPDITVVRNSSATSSPAAPAADTNGNLPAAPYSLMPTTLPGGGTLSIDQSTGVVTATATNQTMTGMVPVRVTVVDLCGASAVRLFNLNVVASSMPSLQSGGTSFPTSEDCSPPNGAVDPGETVTLEFPINNSGATATTNLVATLQASGGVTPITTSQAYGSIPANGSVNRSFQFTATGVCGDLITATLQLQDGATNYGVIIYPIRLGLIVPLIAQNFDSVTPPALPADWASATSSNTSPWATSTTLPDSAPNAIFATTVAAVSDNQLISPMASIPATGAHLSFRHRWNLENGFDGGVIEISINGAAFTDIIPAGGSFANGGYNGTISTNYGSPIAGRSAWTGNVNAGYTTTTLNLPAAASGKTAQFRWRLASDDSVSVDSAVWRIDNILLTSSTYVCTDCFSPPTIGNGPPPAEVVVGTPYNFAFSASGNPAPVFSIGSGILPPGLALSSNGVLAGTVNSVGTENYLNIIVMADNGNPPAAQTTFGLTIVTRAANYLENFGLTGPNAELFSDPDSDGLSNLAEYALGLIPTVADVSDLPVVAIKNYDGVDYLSMTFHRSSAATDITYTVQASGDLVTWIDIARSAGGAQTSGAGFMSETGSVPDLTVEVRDIISVADAPDGKRFLRLEISSP